MNEYTNRSARPGNPPSGFRPTRPATGALHDRGANRPLRIGMFQARVGLFFSWPVRRSAILSIFVCTCVLAAPLHGGGWCEKPDNGGSPPCAKSGNAISGHDRWTLQCGVAMITSNVINDFSLGRVRRATGDAGGEMYLLGASYTLCDLDWTLMGRRYRPQLELPAVFGVVDEGGRSPFFAYNAGITVRWKDLPFSRYVYTNFESGVGLSYTEHVLAIERQRHPRRDRSHLKFYWPIQLMLAHPKRKEHQLVVFIHHQSGGHVFDVGGSNLIGVGYRHVFRERCAGIEGEKTGLHGDTPPYLPGTERCAADSRATGRERDPAGQESPGTE